MPSFRLHAPCSLSNPQSSYSFPEKCSACFLLYFVLKSLSPKKCHHTDKWPAAVSGLGWVFRGHCCSYFWTHWERHHAMGHQPESSAGTVFNLLLSNVASTRSLTGACVAHIDSSITCLGHESDAPFTRSKDDIKRIYNQLVMIPCRPWFCCHNIMQSLVVLS
jgi:hypothetical protein